jgi:hypothetical protein
VEPLLISSFCLSLTSPLQVTTMLSEVDSWQFDAFKLMDVTGGRPLSVLAYHLFKRYDVSLNDCWLWLSHEAAFL